jgi:type I restriction enzyme S subunit
VKGIRGSDLRLIKVHVPPLHEQIAIRAVVTAYDDLIATNQRRIQLLEDAARRLYREWFVRLRYPGHELVTIKDGVPQGWSKVTLAEAADFINGFAFKPAHLLDHGLPIVKIPELRNGISKKTPFNPGLGVPERNKIDTGDLLFSWSATFLVNEWGEGPALLNQHLFKVVSKNSVNKRLIRFAIEDAIPSLLGHSVGATMQHIRRSALDDHFTLIPDETIGRDFAAVIDPLMDQVLTLQSKNNRLTKVRDLLLPKLMSGQLDVSSITLLDEVVA